MHRHTRQISSAAGLHSPWAGPWSWRDAVTVLLLLVSLPVFVGAALVANLVAAPLLVLILIGERVQNLRRIDPAQSRAHLR
jgi:hypothetical protein